MCLYLLCIQMDAAPAATVVTLFSFFFFLFIFIQIQISIKFQLTASIHRNRRCAIPALRFPQTPLNSGPSLSLSAHPPPNSATHCRRKPLSALRPQWTLARLPSVWTPYRLPRRQVTTPPSDLSLSAHHNSERPTGITKRPSAACSPFPFFLVFSFLAMIKHRVASTVLQATRTSITTSLSKAQSAKMTTADSSLPPPQARSFRPEDVKQNRPENQPAPYFPMPYRDAAYQWVRFD